MACADRQPSVWRPEKTHSQTVRLSQVFFIHVYLAEKAERFNMDLLKKVLTSFSEFMLGQINCSWLSNSNGVFERVNKRINNWNGTKGVMVEA